MVVTGLVFVAIGVALGVALGLPLVIYLIQIFLLRPTAMKNKKLVVFAGRSNHNEKNFKHLGFYDV